jgi:endoglucanase
MAGATLHLPYLRSSCPDQASSGASRSASRGATTMRQISSTELARELSPGLDLGNTLEALPTETSWGNPPTTQKIMGAYPEAIRAIVESGR